MCDLNLQQKAFWRCDTDIKNKLPEFNKRVLLQYKGYRPLLEPDFAKKSRDTKPPVSHKF